MKTLTGYFVILQNYYYKRFKCDNGIDIGMFIECFVFQKNIYKYTIYRWNDMKSGIYFRLICDDLLQNNLLQVNYGVYSWNRIGPELTIVVTIVFPFVILLYFVYVLKFL